MSDPVLIAVVLLLAYLIGSIPTAVWVSKLVAKSDIREHGSKNAGLTNVFRVMGWKPALPVMLVDLSKGFLSPYIAMKYSDIIWLPLAAGLLTIVGHSLTCFAGFRGGKGVLTTLGVFLCLAPAQAGLSFGVWFLVTFISKYVSLGSIVGCLALGSTVTWKYLHEPGTHWGLMALTWLVAFFVIFKHKANIKRLLAGTENRFGSGKK